MKKHEKIKRRCFGALVCGSAAFALSVAASSAAWGQGYTPIYSLDFGNPTLVSSDGATTTAGAGRRFGAAVAYFPAVSFYRSGDFPNQNTAGSSDIRGGLAALDITYATGGVRQPTLDFGGWFFVQNNNFFNAPKNKPNVWEVHGRAYLSGRRDLGIQVAKLGSINPANPGVNYTVFLVSEYSSTRARKRARGTLWAVQGGLGVFINPNFDADYGPDGGKHTTTGFSGFISGSVEISKRVSLTLNEWYLRDRTNDINRIGLGLGYAF